MNSLTSIQCNQQYPNHTSSLLAYNYQDKILINILFNSNLDRKTQKSLKHVLLLKHIKSLTILDHHTRADFYQAINMSENHKYHKNLL